MDNICVDKISERSSCEVSELASNQEEADSKLLLHTKHSIHNNPDHKIVIRSPSGDIDINILFINIFTIIRTLSGLTMVLEVTVVQ